MIKRCGAAMLAGLALLAAGAAHAQAIEKPNVSIAMGSWGIIYMPLTLADTKGFFKKEGLNAKVADFNAGGTQALQSLLAGATDMVLGFYDHTIQMQVQDKHIRCVVLLSTLATTSLAVRSDLAGSLHGPADFKGKRIGIPALGSSGEFLVRYLMKRAGLQAKDYTLVPIGAQGTAVAAVEHKDVDGVLTSDPAQTIMSDRGLIKVLMDGRTHEGSKEQFGGDYPAACIYTTEQFLKQNPGTVQHVVNAMVATLAWMKAAQARRSGRSAAARLRHGRPAGLLGDLLALWPGVRRRRSLRAGRSRPSARRARELQRQGKGRQDRPGCDLHERVRRSSSEDLAMSGVALVTGGSRGIGAATCILLGERGWRVAVNYRENRDRAEQTVAAVKAAGGEGLAVQGDTASEADVKRIFAETNAAFGTLTGLVNNAAINGRRGPFAELDSPTMERVLAVNVLGPMLCAREAILQMSTARGGKGGAIVNVSSGASNTGSPFGQVIYGVSKGAVNTLTVGLGQEYAREGVRVNTVSPGLTETDMPDPEFIALRAPSLPLGRMAQPREIAEAIVWLLSEQAGYVSSAYIRVAGGKPG